MDRELTERIIIKEAQLRKKIKAKTGGDKGESVHICSRSMVIQVALMRKIQKKDCSKITKQDLEAVLILILDHLEISALKREDFFGFFNLEWLILSSNKIHILPKDIFKDLHKL